MVPDDDAGIVQTSLPSFPQSDLVTLREEFEPIEVGREAGICVAARMRGWKKQFLAM
jgi:hypothetical protein